MKIKELLRKLNQVLETDERGKGREQHDALKKILKKLKAKQNHLSEKLKNATELDKPKLAKKLKTVRAHREKALRALRQLPKS